MATPYHKTQKEIHTDYLDWFDNSRYQDLDQLEPWQILALLEERASTYPSFLLRLSVDKSYTKKIKNRVKKIQDDPLYYQNTEYSDLSDDAKRYFHKRRKSVHPVIEQIPFTEDPCNWDIVAARENLSLMTEIAGDFQHKESPSQTSAEILNIDIDLSAPESKIKADFHKLLKAALNARNEYLKSQSEKRKIPKFSTANKVIEGLIKHRVFQYLDILIVLDHLKDEHRYSPEKLEECFA